MVQNCCFFFVDFLHFISHCDKELMKARSHLRQRFFSSFNHFKFRIFLALVRRPGWFWFPCCALPTLLEGKAMCQAVYVANMLRTDEQMSWTAWTDLIRSSWVIIRMNLLHLDVSGHIVIWPDSFIISGCEWLSYLKGMRSKEVPVECVLVSNRFPPSYRSAEHVRSKWKTYERHVINVFKCFLHLKRPLLSNSPGPSDSRDRRSPVVSWHTSFRC